MDEDMPNLQIQESNSESTFYPPTIRVPGTFSLSRHADKKLEPRVLELQTGGLRDKINIDSNAGHTSRSTFLAEAAESADVFAPEHCWPRHHQDDDAVYTLGRSQPDVLPDQSGREAGRGRHKCRSKVRIQDHVQST